MRIYSTSIRNIPAWATTKTLGPLHFEDLEPKRFEDLARQLIYDFKPWRRLEATGRAGSDDGFDARGYEMTGTERVASLLTDDSPDGQTANGEDDDAFTEGTDDRLWLVQCKRERAIGPTKLVGYLDDIVLGESEKLHGIVFTAACDFSKRARDQFATKCRALGVEDWQLWGKAELEDRLFQPANDHLLFAYFGISLTIRRRAQRADLRAKLVMKRKANRVLKDKLHTHVLLRSPDATTYPYSGDIAAFKKSPGWLSWQFRGLAHDGLKFCVQRYFAYLADDGKSWDAAMCVNDARGHRNDDPWLGRDYSDDLRQKAYDVWNEIPEANRAWLDVVGIVPFEDVLDIDELGDEFVKQPHIYVPFRCAKDGPFAHYTAELETIARWDARSINPPNKTEGRIEFFPAELRPQNEESE